MACFVDTEAEVKLDRTLYGHSARVWDVRMLRDVIVSVGEVIIV